MVSAKFLSFGVLLAGLETVVAQTAPGFPVSAGAQLGVTFGTNVVSPAGELIPRGDTVNPPNITTPVWTSANRAILLIVDSDVPRNNTRVELLHWLVSNVTRASSNSTALVFPGPGEAPYRQPSPPVGDVPHAYTVILFAQPANFSVPAQFQSLLETRVPFNVSAFAIAAGLSRPALAANYIRVQNLTGTPTQTFPPPRATATNGTSATTSVASFPGGAPSVVLGADKVFWAGMVASILAGVAAFAL